MPDVGQLPSDWHPWFPRLMAGELRRQVLFGGAEAEALDLTMLPPGRSSNGGETDRQGLAPRAGSRQVLRQLYEGYLAHSKGLQHTVCGGQADGGILQVLSQADQQHRLAAHLGTVRQVYAELASKVGGGFPLDLVQARQLRGEARAGDA